MFSRWRNRDKYEEVEAETEPADDLETGDQVSSSEEILVHVKAPDDKVYDLNVILESTVKDLMVALFEVTEIEPERQRLIHFGKMLNQKSPSTKISEIGVKNGDFIHLMPLPKSVANVTNTAPGSEDDYSGNAVGPGFRFTTNDYFEDLELTMWRQRVRLLSTMMLFYYFLQCMGTVSVWLHPEELDDQYQKNHHPSNFVFSLDFMESVMGMTAAMAGMKASAVIDPRFSQHFFRSCLEVMFVHFFGFIIYYREVLAGSIVVRNPFSNRNPPPENLVASVMMAFIFNLMVWSSIITTAIKFHYGLMQQVGETLEEESTEEETVENQEIV